jgi:hypothetical protein
MLSGSSLCLIAKGFMMDERYTGAPDLHQQFSDTMRAVEEAQPSYGKGMGDAIAQAIMQEEAGGAPPELLTDPQDMIGSDDEVAMGHDVAGCRD